MYKTEFINAVAEKTNMTKKDADVAVQAVLDVIKDTLKSGDSVQFVGFGTFKNAVRKGRTGIVQLGSKKGESYQTEDKNVVRFKASAALNDYLN